MIGTLAMLSFYPFNGIIAPPKKILSFSLNRNPDASREAIWGTVSYAKSFQGKDLVDSPEHGMRKTRMTPFVKFSAFEPIEAFFFTSNPLIVQRLVTLKIPILS